MNRGLIEERCRAGGLSVHQAAIDACVDHMFIWEEAGDFGDDRIPLGVLRRLSRIIDADLNELTQTRHMPPTPGDNDGDIADDVRVEAALAEFADGTTRDALAEAFRWTLARVERALAALEVRLRPTGRRLRHVGWQRYTLGPNLSILTTIERTQLIRSTGPPNLDQDEALYQILQGFGTVGYHKHGPGQTAIPSLERRRLVVRERSHYQATADVAFSLCLQD
jgi:hypothetical protein